MADAIDTDDCSPALQVDFAGKTALHPSSGWLPRHCTTEPDACSPHLLFPPMIGGAPFQSG